MTRSVRCLTANIPLWNSFTLLQNERNDVVTSSMCKLSKLRWSYSVRWRQLTLWRTNASWSVKQKSYFFMAVLTLLLQGCSQNIVQLRIVNLRALIYFWCYFYSWWFNINCAKIIMFSSDFNRLLILFGRFILLLIAT